MSFKAELILALCLVWGWSREMIPSDLCLLLLWLVMGLEMKENGAGNTNAVVCPPQGSCVCPGALPRGLLSCGRRRRCSHGWLPSRGTQPWMVEREEVKHTAPVCLSLWEGLVAPSELGSGETEQPSWCQAPHRAVFSHPTETWPSCSPVW